MTAVTAHPFRKSFAFAGGLLIVAAAGITTCGPMSIYVPISVALALAISALITGALVRRSSRVWPLWQIAALFAPVAIIVLAITYFVYNTVVLMLALG